MRLRRDRRFIFLHDPLIQLRLAPHSCTELCFLRELQHLHPHGLDVTQHRSMEKAWKRFDAAFDDLAAHLEEAGVGNYRITGGVSYAEFELISILNLIKRVSFDEAWKRLEGRNGGRWAKLMDLPLYRKLLPANRLNAML